MLAGINSLFPLTGPQSLGPEDLYAGNVPGDYGYKEPRVNVWIESKPGSNEYAVADRIDWRTILQGIDGEQSTATLEAALDAEDLAAGGELGERHFSHLIEQLSPDRRVMIVQSRGATRGKILFCGYPMPQTIDWSSRGESFDVSCIDAGEERLSTGFYQLLRGWRMRFDPLATWDAGNPNDENVEVLSTVFNAGGRPNRSATAYPYAIGGETYRVHLFVDDDERGAKHWRYVDALRYLLLHYVLRARDGAPIKVEAFFADTADLVELEEVETEDPLIAAITAKCEDVSCRSVSVWEALTLLCDEAHLHWAIDCHNTGTPKTPIAEHRLRVWASLSSEEAVAATPDRQMGSPVIDDLPREAPFTDLADRTAREIAEAGAIVQARLSIDNRRVQPIHLGGPKLHEVTLLLRPWWLPHEQLDDLTTEAAQKAAWYWWHAEFGQYANPGAISQYNTKSPDHAGVKDVARLWAFPDTIDGVDPDSPGESPYARTNWPASLYSPFSPDDPLSLVYAHATLGAGIEEARDWVPRRRPFLSTIGRREGATDRTPIVWINYNATDPLTALAQPGWVPLSHGYQIDARRGAVWITADNLLLDANLRTVPEIQATGAEDQYLKAYIEGRLQLAVTCCIANDQRLYYEPELPSGGPARQRYQLYDHGDQVFPHGDRSHNVRADEFVLDDEPAYSEVDSTERFEKFAERDARYKQQPVVAGTSECFWLEDRWRTGDGFAGCEGLGLAFDNYPAIRRVQWTNGPGGQRTVLHLTDMRERPELEAAA